MRTDFSEERAREMVFPSCAEEQSQDSLGKRHKLPSALTGRRPRTAVEWRVQTRFDFRLPKAEEPRKSDKKEKAVSS